MEIHTTADFAGTKGTAVRLTIGSHITGVNVQLDYSGNVTTFNSDHFADILIALVLGVEHIEKLPGYCQCELCRNTRGVAFAERLAAAQAERLRAADEGRT